MANDPSASPVPDDAVEISTDDAVEISTDDAVEISTDDAVEISTDGACLGNPGPGGWGAVLRYRGTEKEISGSDPATTNNKMELTAAIEGLAALTRPSTVILYTDSSYVRNGIMKWVAGWQRNGWKTADKKPVKNADLWKRLIDEEKRHTVEWRWVKGHSGDHYNEIADALATSAAREIAQVRS